MLLIAYSKSIEKERADKIATLDSLKFEREGEENEEPYKLIKKFESEEEIRIRALNSFLRIYNPTEPFHRDIIGHDRSIGGEGVGFGRLFSQTNS